MNLKTPPRWSPSAREIGGAVVFVVALGAVPAARAQLPGSGQVVEGEPGREGSETGIPVTDATGGEEGSAAHPAPPPAGFVYISPGTFVMGARPEDRRSRGDEASHNVTLTRGFYLQTTEVTQLEWIQLMRGNPSFFAACGVSCPVERVSWWDAIAFANARSHREGLQECYQVVDCSGIVGNGVVTGSGAPRYGPGEYRCESVEFMGLECTGYRLPTEAEWEYAARAGHIGPSLAEQHETHYACDSNPELEATAWFNINSRVDWNSNTALGECSRSELRGPQPVAQLQANAWGLFDMLGNVWEWTHDGYGPYEESAVDPMGAPEPAVRVNRGGAWGSSAYQVRESNRDRYAPESRSNDLGFRLARTAE